MRRWSRWAAAIPGSPRRKRLAMADRQPGRTGRGHERLTPISGTPLYASTARAMLERLVG